MRILLLGGTGLIGRSLCGPLVAAGHAVTVFSRRPALVPRICGPDVQALHRLEAATEAHPPFDAVINLAGEPILTRPWTQRRKKTLWVSRVTLTARLVSQFQHARHRPSLWINGSAIGYYGDRGDATLDESAKPGTGFGAELCRAWEHAAAPAADMGSRLCILRTGIVLAPKGGMLGQMRTPFRMGLGMRLGSGRQWTSWIHAADYTAIVLHLIHHPSASGVFNMTAPHPVTHGEFTAALAAVLRRRVLAGVPAWLVKSILGERAEIVLGSQRVLPQRIMQLDHAFAHPTLPDALADLLGAGQS